MDIKPLLTSLFFIIVRYYYIFDFLLLMLNNIFLVIIGSLFEINISNPGLYTFLNYFIIKWKTKIEKYLRIFFVVVVEKWFYCLYIMLIKLIFFSHSDLFNVILIGSVPKLCADTNHINTLNQCILERHSEVKTTDIIAQNKSKSNWSDIASGFHFVSRFHLLELKWNLC